MSLSGAFCSVILLWPLTLKSRLNFEKKTLNLIVLKEKWLIATIWNPSFPRKRLYKRLAIVKFSVSEKGKRVALNQTLIFRV